MRIAVNTLSVVPGEVGGGETYLSNLTRAMAPQLAEGERMVLLVTPVNADLFPRTSGRVVRRVLPVPSRRRIARLLAEHLALPVLLALQGADVLLSPGNALPLLAGLRHVLALQSMHYRFVARDMSPARVRYFRTMVPLAAARAARILCMSADLRRTLLEVAPRAADKARVVYEGADLGHFTPGGRAGAKSGFVMYLSSLNPFKRPDRLVQAVGLLRREGFPVPPVRMFGRPDPRDRERVEAVIREEGVTDLVRIEGVADYAGLPALYREAACLVYPSVLETFGLAPLEAMACGCPVVASNRSSVPEVVGDAAVTVDPDDVPAFAAALRRVLTDDALRADLRRKGLGNVGRFSWERAASETLSELRAAAMLGSTRERR